MKDNSVKSNTIEWLRFFCAVLIVLIHSVGVPVNGSDVVSYQNGVYDIVRIFFSEGVGRVAVPLFFLISGYLFFIGLEEWDKDKWLKKLKRRGKTLLIPYLIWNVIAIVFAFFLLYFRSRSNGTEIPTAMGWYREIGGLRSFWDATKGNYPYNYPLWFIRDLMVIVLVSPLIYQFVKRTKIIGLILLFIPYFFEKNPTIPGLSAEGFFFFSLGAYLSIHKLDFTEFFKKHWIIETCLAVPFLIAMVMTYGNNDVLWEYVRKGLTLFGCPATIGIVALLFERNRLKVHPTLSNSSFLIYAAHARIVLPIVEGALGKVIPHNQIALIIGYFAEASITVAILVLCYYCLSRWIPKTFSFITGGR